MRVAIPLLLPYCEGGVEHVVEVDRKEVKESLAAGCHDGVAGVVNICPCISALG